MLSRPPRVFHPASHPKNSLFTIFDNPSCTWARIGMMEGKNLCFKTKKRHLQYTCGYEFILLTSFGVSVNPLGQIIDVRRADSRTPAFRVLYMHDPYGHQSNHYDWIMDSAPADGFPKILATISEQRLLLLLLRENAKRLPVTLKLRREAYEEEFEPSFLLPVGPLESDEVAEMSVDACAICSKPSTAVCGGCQTVHYCGPGVYQFKSSFSSIYVASCLYICDSC